MATYLVKWLTPARLSGHQVGSGLSAHLSAAVNYFIGFASERWLPGGWMPPAPVEYLVGRLVPVPVRVPWQKQIGVIVISFLVWQKCSICFIDEK